MIDVILLENSNYTIENEKGKISVQVIESESIESINVSIETEPTRQTITEGQNAEFK